MAYFFRQFLTDNKVTVTLANLLSGNSLPENDGIFTFREGDGCNLIDFPDKCFHIAHSNSVIEHVGGDADRIKFVHEMKRVAERYYLQTPNYWFPIEPHFVLPFFHWLPKAARIWLVLHFELGWYSKAKDKKQAEEFIDGCNLLTKNDLYNLCPEATVYEEHIALLVKSFVLISKDNEIG